jgi:PAS domain S-box-containing protein
MRTALSFTGSIRVIGIAAGAAALAFVASYLVRPMSPQMIWFFFFAAVMATARYVGQSCSLLTTAFLIAIGRYFFLNPVESFALDRENAIPVVGFGAMSLCIGGLATAWRRAESHERAERMRFQATVMSIGYAVIAADSGGHVTFMNGIAESLTGWKLTEARGGRLEDVYVVVEKEPAGSSSGSFVSGCESASRNRSGVDRVLIARDRTERLIDDSPAPIKNDRGEAAGTVLVFRDVTERRMVEGATRRRAVQLQTLADIATRINRARDVGSVIRIVTEEARGLIGARQCATCLVRSPRLSRPVVVISPTSSRSDSLRARRLELVDLQALMDAEREPVRLSRDELVHGCRWQALRRAAVAVPTVGGWLAAPLIGRDDTSIGFLQLADKDEGEFTAEDEALVVQLSRLAAIALENATLYEELKANAQRKDEFLAMLSHELRNPLAAMSNAVIIANRTGQPEHIEWSMGVIARQMHHLTRLIDDLLDVSRINRGKIKLRRRVVDALSIVASATDTVRPLVDERMHTLSVAAGPNPLWVDVDPTRLEQVVVNLLNNAVKYSENHGHIEVSAQLDQDDVTIVIRDQGVGIPPDELSEMFELFAQGNRTLDRSEGGLGIGLTIVKKIVEMHGGSIVAKSDGAGKGSSFTIRLPSVAPPSEPMAEEVEPPEVANRKARILVVDDNVDMARGMVRLFDLIGYETKSAFDGSEALAIARQFHPEFVLLDIGLPGMDGYEVVARMRQEETCKDALIVAISGYGQDEDRRRSIELGFDHYLVKPIDHRALLSLISTAARAVP